LFPSIMDVIRLDTSAFGLNGVVQHLAGLTKIRDTDVYSATEFQDANQECMRAQSYKLIRDKVTSKQELYALMRDPAEKRDVLKSEPSVASLLDKSLMSKEKEIDETALSAIFQNKGDLSKKEAQTMRALGYLQ
ncbi:MAG TPA: hypothetical protein VGK34_10085, partial [Armatimonadota bacterium]